MQGDAIGRCEFLPQWLCEQDAELIIAENWQESWDALLDHDIDAFIFGTCTDSVSNGFLSRVRAAFPDLFLLVVADETEGRAAMQAMGLGVCGMLVAPLTQREFVQQFQRLESQRLAALQQRELVRRLEETVHARDSALQTAHEETIHLLVQAAMCRDEDTGTHIKRIGWYSELLAAALGWKREEIDNIRLAAPMHDIGKLGVPDEVLKKPGKLSPAEMAVMQSHTVLGAEILRNAGSRVLRMAAEIALSHHERWDGHGYPQGISGDSIPEAARIVAVVDVYDALSHNRVYRDALSEEATVAELKLGRGTHFDPHVLDVFLTLLPEMRVIGAVIAESDGHMPSRIAS